MVVIVHNWHCRVALFEIYNFINANRIALNIGGRSYEMSLEKSLWFLQYYITAAEVFVIKVFVKSVNNCHL